MLEIKHLHKSFMNKGEKIEILRDINLNVNDGQFVSIIGPSGSGKTTLYKMIGGLESIDQGEILLDGKSLHTMRGQVAYMPQQASLLPWYTVERNVALALQISGVTKKEALTQARHWLDKVGLSAYKDEYPHKLSGGMSQRVSFLRALLSPQKLMLLDEPFGALDALTRLHMQQWLLSLWEQNKRSVLFVTHSIDEALMLSDRIIVISSHPATVIDEIEVPFARPRQEAIWSTEQFNTLKQSIYEQLRETIS